MFGTSLARPVWDITEASWVDHAPNRRFAIWNSGTNSPADDAIFDKETGLIWERSPATDKKPFDAAIVYSTTRATARRKGWRLPAIEELLSLVDPGATNPTLPSGHPFLSLKLDYYYWSQTRGIPFPPGYHLVWGYNFGNADTSCIVVAAPEACYAWLVRGGYGHSYPW